MANTKAVNFRADAMFYQKTKEVLADQKISVSDVLNAALRKIANGTVDPREFVSSDLQDTQYQVAFEDLKKEILVGHQEIAQGKVTSLVFALDWAILPIGGRMAPGETGIWNHFKYLILPASVLGISLTAGVMRYSRSSMLDTMNKDYIKTARAKGLPEWRVNLVHGFRVALTPVVVLIGFRDRKSVV